MLEVHLFHLQPCQAIQDYLAHRVQVRNLVVDLINFSRAHVLSYTHHLQAMAHAMLLILQLDHGWRQVGIFFIDRLPYQSLPSCIVATMLLTHTLLFWQ